MAAPTKHVIELGFVEDCESWKLQSYLFPSKVGGKPAWLSLQNIPGIDDITCSKCGKLMLFLMQVYAILEDKEDCFHRTIFVFICRNAKCFLLSPTDVCVAFRSQLPKVNDFYSILPPSIINPSISFPPTDSYEKLCNFCGCKGPKICAKCHKIGYCSREHQVLDWKTSHKYSCCTEDKPKTQLSQQRPATRNNVSLLPEFELITEPEEFEEVINDKDKSEEDSFLKSKLSQLKMTDATEKELEEMAKEETSEDKIFRKFKTRISHDPEQVLRYDRGGEPLLVSMEGQPGDIPNCDCGAARTFEFQIMPQLLNDLELDSLEESIDWGTLLVYTCSQSCSTGNNYKREFIWKQDFSN